MEQKWSGGKQRAFPVKVFYEKKKKTTVIWHYFDPYFYYDENGRAVTATENRYVPFPHLINHFSIGEPTKFPENDNFWFRQDCLEYRCVVQLTRKIKRALEQKWR